MRKVSSKDLRFTGSHFDYVETLRHVTDIVVLLPLRPLSVSGFVLQPATVRATCIPALESISSLNTKYENMQETLTQLEKDKKGPVGGKCKP